MIILLIHLGFPLLLCYTFFIGECEGNQKMEKDDILKFPCKKTTEFRESTL